MPEQDSSLDDLQRLESCFKELSRGVKELDKEVQAVLAQRGKRSSAPVEPDEPADAGASGTAL